MSAEFREQVEAVLASMINSKRLAVKEERSHGDDALIVLESAALRIRVVRDRGTVMLEFAPTFEPTNWLSGEFVRMLLDRKDPHPFESETSAVVRLERLGDFLEQNIDQLEILFSPSIFPSTQRTVADRQDERARQRYGLPKKRSDG
jgi:hypothetical protein